MTTTLIIVCDRCEGLLMAQSGQKTRTCPYCGAKVEVEKAKNVGSAPNAYEASSLLRKLKREAAAER
jgi:DNA-directed RNA polymerase subunit RPC12/RpoP